MQEGPYEAKKVEDKIYKLWEDSGFLNPDNLPTKSKKKFITPIAPPNITGELHMGHALELTMQDILVRMKRMQGFKTLWIPGIDHAGIAAQNVVEKQLKKEGLTRHDLGREKFEKRIQEWKEKYGTTILNQFKKLGISVDWSRTRYTRDEQYEKAVVEAFKQYQKKGWIYKGYRVINWCVRCGTGISDLEVNYVPEKGKLYYIKYGPFTLATTRPETKLGDTGLAVHPDDKRYKDYIGKDLGIESVDNSISADKPSKIKKIKIKVVADKAVDKEFGTGIIKVTPAHDLTDFEISQRHDLPLIKIIDERGKMNKSAGIRYENLKVAEAREKIIKDLKELGLLEKVEDYEHNIGRCDRCNSIIEPLPSDQWFLKTSELAKLAKEAIVRKEVLIYPENWENIALRWVDNMKDWNISRQLWWGHRLPVWQSKIKSQSSQAKTWDLKIYGKDIFDGLVNGNKTVEIRAGKPMGAEKHWDDFKPGDEITFSLADEKTDRIISTVNSVKKIVKKVSHFKNFEDLFKVYKSQQDYPGKNEKEIEGWWKNHPAMYERIKKYGLWVFELNKIDKSEIYIGDNPPTGYIQADDVLDTWFSSALWPFAVLGWPQKTHDLKTYYPTDFITSDRGILFLWQIRMIFSGKFFTKKYPFKKIYIHPTVLTKDGQRMSKSLGTGVDPIGLIEKYGTDALRFGLAYQNTGVQDLKFGEDHILMGKKFANKLWNINKYVSLKIGSAYEFNDKKKVKNMWTSKINSLVKSTTKDIENYKFGQATHNLYEFIWHEFADKYIEESKNKNDRETKDTLVYLLLFSLKLLHPFMPFVTEEIYQQLPIKNKKQCLMIEDWPR